MKRMQVTGGVLALLATVWFAFGCHDGQDGRMPTDPALDAGSATASFSHSGGVGDDGSGSQFKLFGNARMTRDPENGSNIVLQITNTGVPSGAYRDLHNVQLWQLDHQLNFKWAFVAPHTCGGGSPRIQLLIDANGDRRFQQGVGGDFVAHGHIMPLAGCPASAPAGTQEGPSPSSLLWGWSDLTDELPRWEITPSNAIPGLPPIGPIGGAGAANWDTLEELISGALPNHRVLRAIFLEDFNPTPGVAYYDLITVFDLTLGTRGQWQPERGHGAEGGN